MMLTNLTPPPISNIDTKNDVFFEMYLLSKIAILGIHVSFRGCRCSSWDKETYQSKMVEPYTNQKTCEREMEKKSP